MKNLFWYTHGILILIVIGLLIYISWIKGPEPPITLFPTKTDTIIIEKPIQALTPYRTPVLPSTITEYHIVKVKDKAALAALQLRIYGDSVYIEGLKERIAIHEDYLKQFPSNPKLISLSLDRSQLSLSLLEINGMAKTYDWPISTDYYKYRWTLNSLSTEKSVSPSIRNRLNYYVGLNSTFYGKITPSASFRIEKRWARNIVSINSSMELLDIKVPIVTMSYEYNLRNGK